MKKIIFYSCCGCFLTSAAVAMNMFMDIGTASQCGGFCMTNPGNGSCCPSGSVISQLNVSADNSSNILEGLYFNGIKLFDYDGTPRNLSVSEITAIRNAAGGNGLTLSKQEYSRETQYVVFGEDGDWSEQSTPTRDVYCDHVKIRLFPNTNGNGDGTPEIVYYKKGYGFFTDAGRTQPINESTYHNNFTRSGYTLRGFFTSYSHWDTNTYTGSYINNLQPFRTIGHAIIRWDADVNDTPSNGNHLVFPSTNKVYPVHNCPTDNKTESSYPSTTVDVYAGWAKNCTDSTHCTMKISGPADNSAERISTKNTGSVPVIGRWLPGGVEYNWQGSDCSSGSKTGATVSPMKYYGSNNGANYNKNLQFDIGTADLGCGGTPPSPPPSTSYTVDYNENWSDFTSGGVSYTRKWACNNVSSTTCTWNGNIELPSNPTCYGKTNNNIAYTFNSWFNENDLFLNSDSALSFMCNNGNNGAGAPSNNTFTGLKSFACLTSPSVSHGNAALDTPQQARYCKYTVTCDSGYHCKNNANSTVCHLGCRGFEAGTNGGVTYPSCDNFSISDACEQNSTPPVWQCPTASDMTATAGLQHGHIESSQECKYQVVCDTAHGYSCSSSSGLCGVQTCDNQTSCNNLGTQYNNVASTLCKLPASIECPSVSSPDPNAIAKLESSTSSSCQYSFGCKGGYAYPEGQQSASITCSATSSTAPCTTDYISGQITTFINNRQCTETISASECGATYGVRSGESGYSNGSNGSQWPLGTITGTLSENNTKCTLSGNCDLMHCVPGSLGDEYCNGTSYTVSAGGLAQLKSKYESVYCDTTCPSAERVASLVSHAVSVVASPSTTSCAYSQLTCENSYHCGGEPFTCTASCGKKSGGCNVGVAWYNNNNGLNCRASGGDTPQVDIEFDTGGGDMAGGTSARVANGTSLASYVPDRSGYDGAVFAGWVKAGQPDSAANKNTIVDAGDSTTVTYRAVYTCPSGRSMNQYNVCVSEEDEYFDRSGNRVTPSQLTCWRDEDGDGVRENYCYWNVDVTFYDKPSTASFAVSNGNAGLKLACRGSGCKVASGTSNYCCTPDSGNYAMGTPPTCETGVNSLCASISTPRANDYTFRGYFRENSSDIITTAGITSQSAFSNFFPKNLNNQTISVTGHTVIIMNDSPVSDTETHYPLNVFGGWAKNCEGDAHSQCEVQIGHYWNVTNGLGKGDVRYNTSCDNGYSLVSSTDNTNNPQCIGQTGERSITYQFVDQYGTSVSCIAPDGTCVVPDKYLLPNQTVCGTGFTLKYLWMDSGLYTPGRYIYCTDNYFGNCPNGNCSVTGYVCRRSCEPGDSIVGGRCKEARATGGTINGGNEYIENLWSGCYAVQCDEGYKLTVTTDGVECRRQ